MAFNRTLCTANAAQCQSSRQVLQPSDGGIKEYALSNVNHEPESVLSTELMRDSALDSASRYRWNRRSRELAERSSNEVPDLLSVT